MKIQEVALTQADTDCLLSRLEALVGQAEANPPCLDVEALDSITESAANLPLTFIGPQKDSLYRLAFRLWNQCVAFANQNCSDVDALVQVKVRSLACTMLLLAGENQAIPSWRNKVSSMLLKTGKIWLDRGNASAAEALYRKAAALFGGEEADGISCSADDASAQRLEILISQMQASFSLGKFDESAALLERASKILPSAPNKTLDVASEYIRLGKQLRDEKDSKRVDSNMLLHYFDRAYSLASTCAAPEASGFLAKQALPVRLAALKYLAALHMEGGRFSECLRCCSLVRLLSPACPHWIQYAELKSFAALGRHEEAIHEFRAISKAQRADEDLQDLLCGAVEAMIGTDVPLCIEAARDEVLSFLQSGADVARGLVQFAVDKLLVRPTPLRISVALAIIMDKKTTGTLETSEDQQAIFLTLWNGGTECFHRKEYSAAHKLMEACLLFVQPAEKGMRAKVYRVICLCQMALSNVEEALESIAVAEELDPCIASCFLKFKVCLQRSLTVDAVAALEKMPRCPDFQPDYLTLAAHEALATSGSNEIAIRALKWLLPFYKTDAIPKAPEATALQCLIQMSLQSPSAEVLKLHQHAKMRRDQVQPSIFFGSDEATGKLARYFALSSLQNGIEAAGKRSWSSAAEFFSISSSWFGDMTGSEGERQQALSSILSAASLLANADRGKSSVHDIEVLLHGCEKICSKLEGGQKLLPYVQLLLFELKCIMADTDGQRKVIEACKSLPTIAPDHFFRLSLHAVSPQNPTRNTSIAMDTLRAGLELVASQPVPDFKLAFSAMRSIISALEQSGSDPEDLVLLYREACKLTKDLAEQAPKEDAEWLIATAWNRSPVAAKLRQFREAEQWMALALEYVDDIAPSLSTHKAAMQQAQEELRKLQPTQAIVPMEE